MTSLARDIAALAEILPEAEQEFALEFIKRLVLAWDPDFTKLTDQEYQQLVEAENGEFISENEIDWDHLDQY